MHPLDTELDDSKHRGVQRRRSSLDNSSLTAENTFKQMIEAVEGIEQPRRRLSLDNGATKTTTFLADVAPTRPKRDLDADFHHSEHDKSPSKLSTSTADTESTPNSGFDDSESSLESDGDSFCDASVHEKANREYLRKDLGASCYWNSMADDSFMDLHMTVDDLVDHQVSKVMVEMIKEESQLELE